MLLSWYNLRVGFTLFSKVSLKDQTPIACGGHWFNNTPLTGCLLFLCFLSAPPGFALGESHSKTMTTKSASTISISRVAEHAAVIETHSPTLEDFPVRQKRSEAKNMEEKQGAFDGKGIPGRGDSINKAVVTSQSRLQERPVS